MAKQTICGVSLDAFTQKPTPAELAAVFTKWASDEQAEFFSALAQRMKDAMGWRKDIQIEFIGQELVALERELCDEGGSDLIASLAAQVASAKSEAV